MPKSKRPRIHRAVSREIDPTEFRRQTSPKVARSFAGRILPECSPSWDALQRHLDVQKEPESQFVAAGHATADAWHATYGTHVSRAIMQRNGAEFMPEVVIGNDDRVRIHNTLDYPYSAICSLEITSRTGRRFVGTGWLVSDNTVVTAGHCVYMPEQGGWARRIRVYPGRNGLSARQSSRATHLHSVEGWTKDRRAAADYGAIRLQNCITTSGSFGYLALENNDLQNNLYHVVGYSADKPQGTLWGHVRPLDRVEEDVLYYETDTYGGNSGCPVFFVDEDNPRAIYAVGIHNYGDASGNSATRISAEVFDNISDWRNASL